jgi:hypothetical protein
MTTLTRPINKDTVPCDWTTRSTREIQDRVDALITLIQRGEDKPTDRAEAVVLSRMILRRK